MQRGTSIMAAPFSAFTASTNQGHHRRFSSSNLILTLYRPPSAILSANLWIDFESCLFPYPGSTLFRVSQCHVNFFEAPSAGGMDLLRAKCS